MDVSFTAHKAYIDDLERRAKKRASHLTPRLAPGVVALCGVGLLVAGSGILFG